MQETKNIKFAAYLRLLGIHAEKVERFARGKARYFFKLSDSEWIQLKQKFDKSDFIKYAQCLDAVVDLAY